MTDTNDDKSEPRRPTPNPIIWGIHNAAMLGTVAAVFAVAAVIFGAPASSAAIGGAVALVGTAVALGFITGVLQGIPYYAVDRLRSFVSRRRRSGPPRADL
jgi:predicted phage tail protein